MADNTKIEWTDATWNPITGCSRVSKGCENCYAERLAAGRLRSHPSRAGLTDEHGRWNGAVKFNKQWLEQPLHWKKPRRIFVVAHGDLFYENIYPMWIAEIFGVMAACPQHRFQVLTKRPERMQSFLTLREPPVPEIINSFREKFTPYGHSMPWPLPNVWLGTSVEDQKTADERIPHLLETPAAVRWVSVEPLLGGTDIRPYLPNALWNDLPSWKQPELNWVVVGGESGPGFRPMNEQWARSIRDQCKRSRIPFFMKQMSGKKPIPADLMIREYPKTTKPVPTDGHDDYDHKVSTHGEGWQK